MVLVLFLVKLHFGSGPMWQVFVMQIWYGVLSHYPWCGIRLLQPRRVTHHMPESTSYCRHREWVPGEIEVLTCSSWRLLHRPLSRPTLLPCKTVQVMAVAQWRDWLWSSNSSWGTPNRSGVRYSLGAYLIAAVFFSKGWRPSPSTRYTRYSKLGTMNSHLEWLGHDAIFLQPGQHLI